MQMQAALDLDAIRAEFPALAQDFVFLDNAGGSQVLGRVADRIRDYLLSTSVQLGASYAVSQAASERVLEARRSVAQLINAAHDEEVVMAGATTLLMHLLTTAIAPSIQPGDEIIVTETDHESNVGGWMRLQAQGAVVKLWPVNRETLELDLAMLDTLLSPRTRWVAMTHASNVLGTVNPVAEVARRVHAVGGKLAVDGVAYAPHRLVDVHASGADVYVFSFYKIFGPHYAVLWGRRELLLGLPSLNHFFIGPEVLPYKLQPGNVNFELSYGCIGIADYLQHVGRTLGAAGTPRQQMQAAFDAFAAHEDTLAEQLLGWLRARKGVRIFGRPQVQQADRMPTISFVVAGQRSEDIVRAVDAHRIGIRFGDFYARRLADALDLHAHGGVVRVSMAHYNTASEIDRLIRALDQAIH
ncbi:aminotransferase [beta proteobacterium AAP99]|nr:aminotransferase [beta proteobacterium AAP99]